ncbi:MAG TPA: PorP/SprF family type IX secretion system membrane protein [Bacteroidia bacterium]|nr:PorP/SprF family type IX secretion system membrane protein [Bacteroidia bacterium]
MKKLIAFIAASSFGVLLNAQDVHFSQMTFTPLLLNPAQTALGHDFQAIVNYKDQWKIAALQPYRTFNTSADVAFLKKTNGNHLGLGLDVFSDKAGEGNMGTTTGQLSLSGVLAADNNNFISGGLYSGFGQRTLQPDKLHWDNQYDGMQYDATLPSGEPGTFANRTYFDIGAGIGWFYSKGHSTLSSNDQKKFTAGFSVQHLNRPAYSFYGDNTERLPMKFVAHGNAEIGIKNYSLVLEPAYIVMIQAGHHEINAGMMVKYITRESSKYTGRKSASGIALGGYYRFGDAIALAARYEFSNWSIGTSYDVNISDLKTASKARGGLEISLRFVTPDPFGKTSTSKLFD